MSQLFRCTCVCVCIYVKIHRETKALIYIYLVIALLRLRGLPNCTSYNQKEREKRGMVKVSLPTFRKLDKVYRGVASTTFFIHSFHWKKKSVAEKQRVHIDFFHSVQPIFRIDNRSQITKRISHGNEKKIYHSICR